MSVFQCLTTGDLCRELSSGRNSVVFIGPSINDPLSSAIISKAKQLPAGAVTVVLDYDEHIFRLGYGEVEAVKMLMAAKIPVRKQPGLRISVLLVDDHGWALHQSPMAVEDPNASMHNAIALLPQQVRQIRESVVVPPENKTSSTPEATALPAPEIGVAKITTEEEKRVSTLIRNNPPLAFDLQREVNVYRARLQFVELELTGGHIENHTIQLPQSMREQLFGNDPELQQRLRANYKLIGKRELKGLREIREEVKKLRELTRPLNEQLGRVLLSAHKQRFMAHAAKITAKIERFREAGRKEPDKEIERSLSALAGSFADRVAKNPPPSLLSSQSGRISAKDAKEWLVKFLRKYAPSAESLMQNLNLYCTFKDVTYEMLKNPDFQKRIAEAFPNESWDKLMQESTAVKTRAGSGQQKTTKEDRPGSLDLFDGQL